MNILLLTATNRHAEQFERTLFFNRKNCRISHPQTEQQIFGLNPDLIIETPDWWAGKSEAFIERVDYLKAFVLKS